MLILHWICLLFNIFKKTLHKLFIIVKLFFIQQVHKKNILQKPVQYTDIVEFVLNINLFKRLFDIYYQSFMLLFINNNCEIIIFILQIHIRNAQVIIYEEIEFHEHDIPENNLSNVSFTRLNSFCFGIRNFNFWVVFFKTTEVIDWTLNLLRFCR